jgi:anthranilate phosphoribosyltransferase
VLVVSGTLPAGNACDEVSVFGPTDVVEIAGGVQRRYRWEPEDFGLSRRGAEDLGSLLVDGPAASAAAITAVLTGVPGPARETVAVNSGALLWAASPGATPAEGYRIALEAIDSGAAARTLAALVATSQEPDPVSPS